MCLRNGNNMMYNRNTEHLILVNDITRFGNTIIEKEFSGFSRLKTVQILESSKIKFIGGGAFCECKSLQTIHIPDSVTDIEDNAFHGCTSLQSIRIPNSVRCLGCGAFSFCQSLQSIHLSKSIFIIHELTFSNCKSLQKIHMPNVGIIYDHAFLSCTSLQSIKLPSTLRSIGRRAFSSCTSLKSIHIPNGVTMIQESTFEGCTSLHSVHISENATEIGARAFYRCVSLRSVYIPNSITIIGRSAFDGCSSLQSIVVSSSVTSIQWNAFNACTSLQSIHIPETVTDIQATAFCDCTRLEQRQQNGTNYHPETMQWLRQRFHNLPIHQAYYYFGSNTRQSTSTSSPPNLLPLSLLKSNKQALVSTDAMGMTPLHILCCNPNVTVEVVKDLVGEDHSLLTRSDIAHNTPLHLFLRCKNLLRNNGGVGVVREEKQLNISFQDILHRGIKHEDLKIILILNRVPPQPSSPGQASVTIQQTVLLPLCQQDERTGLFPFMTAAMLPECGLDIAYALAMENPALL